MFEDDYFMEEEFFYLYYLSLTCNGCGKIAYEEDLPYINGMYDYTCDECGGTYE